MAGEAAEVVSGDTSEDALAGEVLSVAIEVVAGEALPDASVEETPLEEASDGAEVAEVEVVAGTLDTEMGGSNMMPNCVRCVVMMVACEEFTNATLQPSDRQVRVAISQ